jgi:hypothetical protein
VCAEKKEIKETKKLKKTKSDRSLSSRRKKEGGGGGRRDINKREFIKIDYGMMMRFTIEGSG